MTDFAKRRSLKGLAAAAAGTATEGFTIPSIAETDLGNGTTKLFVREAHLAIHTKNTTPLRPILILQIFP